MKRFRSICKSVSKINNKDAFEYLPQHNNPTIYCALYCNNLKCEQCEIYKNMTIEIIAPKEVKIIPGVDF